MAPKEITKNYFLFDRQKEARSLNIYFLMMQKYFQIFMIIAFAIKNSQLIFLVVEKELVTKVEMRAFNE